MAYAHKEMAAMDKKYVQDCLNDLEANPNYRKGGAQSAVGPRKTNAPASSNAGKIGPFRKPKSR